MNTGLLGWPLGVDALPSVEVIERIAVGTNNGDIEFLGIPQNYSHLLILGHLRAPITGSGAEIQCRIRVNRDSSASYNITTQHISNTATIENSNAQTYADIGDVITDDSSCGTCFSSLRAFFPEYAHQEGGGATAHAKGFQTHLTGFNNSQMTQHNCAGIINPCGPIRSIFLWHGTGSGPFFKYGSRATLYGLR